MKLRVLASSSKGNCYLLDAGSEILMLECGVRYKEIQQALDFDFSKVAGCLITHEHKDHAKAAADLLKAGIDVYCSEGTAKAAGISGHRLHLFQLLRPRDIGGFTILPFETQHDASQPLGFLILNQTTGEKLVFATDTYYVRHCFNRVNYFLVECNYISEILMANVAAGSVSHSQRERLIQSHFELERVKDFLMANVTTDSRKVVLMHLSDGNSDAARMVKKINELTNIDTVIAEPGMVVDLELYPF